MEALQGLKVLELGQLIAGPFAGKTLGEFGADVIKIEPPGVGDPLRNWRLLQDGTSVWWQVQSRNKRSVALDLRSAEGQEIVRALIAEADVLIENFRPARWKAGAWAGTRCTQLNPRLDHAAHLGLRPDRPVPRPARLRRASARRWAACATSPASRAACRCACGISIGDTLAALHGMIGMLTALLPPQGATAAQGQVIDVALYEVGVQRDGKPDPRVQRVRRGARARPAARCPASRRPTPTAATTAYVLIAGNGDSIFKRLMKAIGRADLGERPGARAQRRPRRARRRDRRRDRGLDARRAPSTRCSRRSDAAQRAGRPRLHRAGHRRATRTTGRAT